MKIVLFLLSVLLSICSFAQKNVHLKVLNDSTYIPINSRLPNNILEYLPATDRYRFWQGVIVGHRGIFTFTDRDEDFGLNNIIQQYDFNGNLLQEKKLAYTNTDPDGLFMSFGSSGFFDTDTSFLIPVYNFNTPGRGTLVSRIARFSATDLHFIEDFEIGGNVAEGVIKYGTSYFVAYYDIMTIKEFDLSWNLIANHTIARSLLPAGGYQSIFNIGNDFYCIWHGDNNFGTKWTPGMDHFIYNGTNFTFVNNISLPAYGLGQGVSLYNGKYYYADRPGDRIVISNNIITARADDIKASDIYAGQYRLSDLNTAPSSSTDAGTKGEVRFTSSGIYICISTNSWIKCTGSTF